MTYYNRQDAKEAAEGVSLAAIGIVVLILLVGGGSALVWWLSTSTSGIKGRGDLQQQRNSAANIAHWSATFNGLNQNIIADQATIKVAADAAGAPGATRQDQINLEGAKQNCITDVAAYNGDILNTLAVVPAGLPASYDSSVCGG